MQNIIIKLNNTFILLSFFLSKEKVAIIIYTIFKTDRVFFKHYKQNNIINFCFDYNLI